MDHFSWSAFGENKDGSVNGYVNPCEKMKNETIDKFTQVRSCVSWALGGVGWPLPKVLELFKKEVGHVPHLWKADIDAAFRRIPIKPEERWMCGIAFMVDGQVFATVDFPADGCFLGCCVLRCAQAQVWWVHHLAASSGAVGSVHGWERMGAALAHIARVHLKLPILRYVDDFFAQ